MTEVLSDGDGRCGGTGGGVAGGGEGVAKSWVGVGGGSSFSSIIKESFCIELGGFRDLSLYKKQRYDWIMTHAVNGHDTVNV